MKSIKPEFTTWRLIIVGLVVVTAAITTLVFTWPEGEEGSKLENQNTSSTAQNGPILLETREQPQEDADQPAQETAEPAQEEPTGASQNPSNPNKPVENQPASSTNCLPPDASEYATHYINQTTSQYLQTGTYLSTKEFKKALDFAGLTSLVDRMGVVVFAPNDDIFSNLTPAQKDYIYASKENMKSLIGWQIVTSCVIWDGDIESVTATRTIQTLNGPLTYKAGSPGQLNGVTVAIWDFFTSNGAVHYSGLLNKAAIP